MIPITRGKVIGGGERFVSSSLLPSGFPPSQLDVQLGMAKGMELVTQSSELLEMDTLSAICLWSGLEKALLTY